MKKRGTSYRLSVEALDLLTRIAALLGISRASVIELLIREKALSLQLLDVTHQSGTRLASLESENGEE